MAITLSIDRYIGDGSFRGLTAVQIIEAEAQAHHVGVLPADIEDIALSETFIGNIDGRPATMNRVVTASDGRTAQVDRLAIREIDRRLDHGIALLQFAGFSAMKRGVSNIAARATDPTTVHVFRSAGYEVLLEEDGEAEGEVIHTLFKTIPQIRRQRSSRVDLGEEPGFF